jgi:hypothetical protein
MVISDNDMCASQAYQPAKQSECRQQLLTILMIIDIDVQIAVMGTEFIRTKTVRVKVEFTLEHSTKAQMGSRGIALLFL